MATVTGLTAVRMLAIEAASVVSGTVDLGGDLILTTYGGDKINAGNVKCDVGPVGVASEVFTQAVPSAVWIINHTLQFNPAVTVVDSSGISVEGDVSYPNANMVQIGFASAFSGTAYMS